jgi:gliding motility-associated-like protein
MFLKQLTYCLIFILLAGSTKVSSGQSNERYYRIIAVSKADSTITSTSNVARSILPMNIKVPSAFSPNGDGLNDTFGILSEGIEDFKIVIYNRWGEVVFQADHPKARWDGTFKGEKAPVGVYGVELMAKNANSESMVKKTSLTLVN